MTIYIYPLSPTDSIKIWDLKDDMALIQGCFAGKKSRKSTCKVKECCGKKYVTCLGHRYYLDKFQQVDI